jgi:hypothetical protein
MQVPIALYPQLRRLCWNRPGDVALDGADALAVYEGGWRHLDEAALTAAERALIDELVARHGAGVLLVREPHLVAPGAFGAPARLAPLLEALDADLLEEAGCVLGGGAAVALSLGAYREVGGVRVLCASAEGYRVLKARLHEAGLDALLRVPGSLKALRAPRADPWGVLAAVEVEGRPVRVELARELGLGPGSARHPELGVPVLGRVDLFCERLLSNADRWANPASLGRDAIDLLVMTGAWGPIPEAAWAKAWAIGGDLVEHAHAQAMAGLSDPAQLARCGRGLSLSVKAVARVRAALELAE